MNIEEFKEKTDLYSADLSRWPQEQVKDAVAFMKENAEAAAYFDRTLKLDEQLRGYEPAAADLAALESRIMQAIGTEMRSVNVPPPAATAWRPAWLFAPGGGLLAIALVGFFMGFTPPQTQVSDNTPLDPAYVAEEQLASLDTDNDDDYYGDIY